MRQLSREPATAASAPALEQYRQICELTATALAGNQLDALQHAILRWLQFPHRHRFPDPLRRLCADPFEPERFAALPPQVKLYLLQGIFRHHIPRLIDLQPQVEFLLSPGALSGLSKEFQQPFLYLLIVALLLRGETARAAEVFRRHQPKLGSCGLRGWLLFMEDDFPAAIRSFKSELNHLRRREENPAAFFTGFEGLIMLLALLAEDNHRHLPLIKKILGDLEAIQPHNPLRAVYRMLGHLTSMLGHHSDPDHLAGPRPHLDGNDAVVTLFDGLIQRWRHQHLPASLRPRARELGHRARQQGFAWLADNYDNLLAPTSAATLPLSRNLQALIKCHEPWHNALLAWRPEPDAPAAQPPRPCRRLAWQLADLEAGDGCRLKPVLQQRRGDDSWSRGRPVALWRLVAALPSATPPSGDDRHPTPESLPLSRQDREICAWIRSHSSSAGTSYYLPRQLDLNLLVGHPHLFLAADPAMPVQVEHGHPTLLVEPASPGQLLIRLNPPPGAGEQVLQRRSENLFQVITYPPSLRQLATRLGPAGQRWPLAEAAALRDFLAELPPELSVFSCLDLDLPDSPSITPDHRLVLQLFPAASGLHLRLRSRPLGPDGPDLDPGQGPPILWARVNERRRHLKRDLAWETRQAQALASRCGLPADQADKDHGAGAVAWTVSEPRRCLEILTRLHHQQPPVPQEWPAGRALSVSPTVELHKLHLKISKNNDWFGLSGELQLDDGLVVELSSLLQTAHRSRGRFIPLGRGRFLSLSRELRQKIDEIEALAEIRQGQVRLHPLAARLLLTADQGEQRATPRLAGDAGWQEFLAQLERQNQHQPPPPGGFKARLRPYQLTGYRWLRQMAELGLGACLADDMGLGKTIQALALIVARAKGGPCLVVAPTSLCHNWQEEAGRFAPGLKVIPYGGRQRRRWLDNLPAAGLVICSYGMLQRDSDLLGAVHWHTVVLDEAQAIKNFLAKRSRAAMRLKADCKLITTGTPLENHLAELWTLFRFINPGLLGSLEQFSKKFITPIEQHHDQPARQRLQKLLTPFILRRLKKEVLPELPPRTDITLQVTMQREEAALYEALRRQAKASLQEANGRGREAPLQVLAAIMKLRRACCHPRLVLPDSPIAGAKLELFGKVVRELRENRHRILVFSQFVDHLSLIREYLEQQDISYQYFDGATPAAARQRRVRGFQQGRGDLFLISLRAGGLGLNLTAADYVIHLDPWWNPAVEEQASDRAHRIGQNKPVTIYRLITTGTIEEKIRAMHHRKRRLASDLLDATRSGPPRSYEELLALLEK